MTRCRRVWFGTLVGFCVLLLAGCSEDGVGDDDGGRPSGGEPTIVELGLRLAPAGLDLTGLLQADIDQVARGSYLVNGVGICFSCHSSPAGYLAGGLEFPLPFADVQGFTSVVARNLTPDAETGFRRSEDEFIEMMRTGKDFEDSTAEHPQQLLIMPWPIYRFMSRADLQAIFAFLQRIPPVHHDVREHFTPPFPLSPIPFSALEEAAPTTDPDNAERGLRLPQFFSSPVNDPNFQTFIAQFSAAVDGLSAESRARVGRGSYLVNAVASCNDCHTAGVVGLIPETVDVNTGRYLAGGVNIGVLLGLGDIFSRNLTPDPATGLTLSEEEFIQTLRFGADFRRPGTSLRLVPHFPTEYRLTRDDLRAIYAYLQVIPAVVQEVAIVP